MNLDHIAFRPSKAPGVAACPSFMYRPKGARIESVGNMFSTLGTALHKVFEVFVSQGVTPTQEELRDIAHQYNVDIEGYYGIGWRSKRMADRWTKVAAYFTDPQRELELRAKASNGYEVIGHPDIFQVFGADYAVVLDLKMGEQDGIDFFEQGAWYAWLVWKLYGVQSVYVTIFAPILDTYETRCYTPEKLQELEERFIEACMQAGVVYQGPNAMCRFCPNATDCKAISKAIDPLVDEYSPIKSGGRQITPADVARMRPWFQVMAQWAEHFNEACKVLIEKFGPIPLADGKFLHLIEDHTTEFKPFETFHNLRGQGIDEAAILGQMSISKKGVQEAVKTIAVPRSPTHGVAVLQKRILADLEAQGATEAKPRRRLAVKSSPQLTKSEEVE